MSDLRTRAVPKNQDMTFDEFFHAATGHEQPFDYQRRLACGPATPDPANNAWLTQGTPCASRLINIPTGLGKTAAVVLAWLWNRVRTPDSSNPTPPWPRRLVYCLPMRTLVEQTQSEVEKWLGNLLGQAGKLGLEGNLQDELRWLQTHSPVVLMGGEELESKQAEWDIYPEKPCILIGTQDMLLSRALNRGYGMSRYRWPMHFGLLNNDCLWVMDETQLMGVGVETSAQLEAFRQTAGGTFNGCPTWWMSATLEPARLATVDHPEPTGSWPALTLADADRSLNTVQARFEAKKPLTQASWSLSAASKKVYAKEFAKYLLKQHHPGTLTLVVVNTVTRAQEIYRELEKLKLPEPLALIHSRFRRADRRRHQAVLEAQGGRIVIATQAVEAGVDVSACTLITELAPWSSLVQRFGRCNRRGEFPSDAAQILWVDIASTDTADDLLLPYTASELGTARDLLRTLTDAGSVTLSQVACPPEKAVVRPVLRRKDLLELFDTTPDLAGHDLDIARYIRDGDDTDVQVFWRDLASEAASENLSPSPDELVRVSLPRFRRFLQGKTKPRVQRWNPLSKNWEITTQAQAGGVFLLDLKTGGYDQAIGWTGEAEDQPTALHPSGSGVSEPYDGDRLSFERAWITLRDHTRHVEHEAARLLAELVGKHSEVLPSPSCETSTETGMSPNSGWYQAVLDAARWHDVGKTHPVFQKALRKPAEMMHEAYAKSKNPPARYNPPEHRYFRHELASALTWLQTAPADVLERDLVAFLVAAHHGKVRLSLRSLPGEEPPHNRPEARLARGVLDGDPVGPVELDGLSLPALTLDLSLMEMGWDPKRGPSWLARMIGLRDRFGPFRLAWLETLLRAADARASGAEMRSNKVASTGVQPAVELREEPAVFGTGGSLSPEEQALVAEIVADGLSIQDKFRPEPLYKQTGRGHYTSNTVEEIRQAKQSVRKEQKS